MGRWIIIIAFLLLYGLVGASEYRDSVRAKPTPAPMNYNERADYHVRTSGYLAGRRE